MFAKSHPPIFISPSCKIISGMNITAWKLQHQLNRQPSSGVRQVCALLLDPEAFHRQQQQQHNNSSNTKASRYPAYLSFKSNHQQRCYNWGRKCQTADRVVTRTNNSNKVSGNPRRKSCYNHYNCYQSC